jgi:hypothetical protein
MGLTRGLQVYIELTASTSPCPSLTSDSSQYMYLAVIKLSNDQAIHSKSRGMKLYSTVSRNCCIPTRLIVALLTRTINGVCGSELRVIHNGADILRPSI